MEIQIEVINNSDYQVEGIKDLIKDFLNQLNFKEDTGISIMLCNNEFIKELNKKYLNHDYATDVLAFPAQMPRFLGDIVVSVEKALEQNEKSLVFEIELLLCHGLLHLLDYDHEKSEMEEKDMFQLQEKLLHNKKKELKIK